MSPRLIRNIFFFLLTLTATTLLARNPASTARVINTEDYSPGIVRMDELVPPTPRTAAEMRSLRREERLLLRVEKRLEKIAAKPPARIRGFSDDTDKWFWLWAIGWGLGILLLIVSGGALSSVFLSILWILGFVGGSAALIVWLIKRHGD
jgi:hypothetical protein